MSRFFPDMRDKYRILCGATSFHIYDVPWYAPVASLFTNDSSRLRGKKCTWGKSPGAQAVAERSLMRSGR
jgi:hypothetical protein